MDSYERLIRVIFWLWKRDWGLSFLLAFASFLIFMPALGGPLEALFEGPVFRTGVYVGTIVFPNSATRGTNGFYLAGISHKEIEKGCRFWHNSFVEK
jgi:hypothetical protein